MSADLVALGERLERVARDLVAVQRGEHVLVERDADRGRRGAERRRANVGGRPPQRSEAAHVDGRLRLTERRLVVVALVEVAHALGIREIVQPARIAALEKERRLHPPLLDELRDERSERSPVGGGQRLAKAAEMRHGHVGVVRGRAHGGNETGVQERHVGRRHERQLAIDRLQAGQQPLERPLALARVLDDTHAVGQLRKLLIRRPHDHDRPVGAARDDPARAPQQRAAVPVQPRLRRPHAARAAAGEHDPGSHKTSVLTAAASVRCRRSRSRASPGRTRAAESRSAAAPSAASGSASSNGSHASGTKSSSSVSAAALRPTAASARPDATATAASRWVPTTGPVQRGGIGTGVAQHALEQHPRPGARGPKRDRTLQQVADGRDGVGVAARQDDALLAAPEMDEDGSAAGEDVRREAVVVAAVAVSQMERGGVGALLPEGGQAAEAARRPDAVGAAGDAVEQRIVAARQPERPPAMEGAPGEHRPVARHARGSPRGQFDHACARKLRVGAADGRRGRAAYAGVRAHARRACCRRRARRTRSRCSSSSAMSRYAATGDRIVRCGALMQSQTETDVGHRARRARRLRRRRAVARHAGARAGDPGHDDQHPRLGPARRPRPRVRARDRLPGQDDRGGQRRGDRDGQAAARPMSCSRTLRPPRRS